MDLGTQAARRTSTADTTADRCAARTTAMARAVEVGWLQHPTARLALPLLVVVGVIAGAYYLIVFVMWVRLQVKYQKVPRHREER